jgi:hypothetical protein
MDAGNGNVPLTGKINADMISFIIEGKSGVLVL